MQVTFYLLIHTMKMPIPNDKQLEILLKSLFLEKIAIYRVQKIKNRLFAKIEIEIAENAVITAAIVNGSKKINVPQSIKNNIFRKIDELSLIHSILQFFRTPKKTFAGISLGLLLAAVIFSFSFNPTPIYATQKTILEIDQGSATINRNGIILTAHQRAILEVGDIITTEPDSRATIYFPTEAISRLSGKSEVKIRAVAINPEKPEENSVEIEVNQGRVWNNVVSKNNNQGSFNVKTPSSVSVAVTKATFDVEITEGKNIQISTIQNEVTVNLSNNKSLQIAEGEKAEIDQEETVVHTTGGETTTDVWISNNMLKDSNLIENNEETANNIDLPINGKLRNVDNKTSGSSNSLLTETITNNQPEIFDETQSNLTNAELLQELKNETSPLSQFSASPDATVKRTRKAVLDLYYEQQKRNLN